MDMAKWPTHLDQRRIEQGNEERIEHDQPLESIPRRPSRNERRGIDANRAIEAKGGPTGRGVLTTRRPVARSLGLIYLTSLTPDF